MASIPSPFNPNPPLPTFDPGGNFPTEIPANGPSIGPPDAVPIPEAPPANQQEPDEGGMPEDFPPEAEPDPAVQNDSLETGTVVADSGEGTDAGGGSSSDDESGGDNGGAGDS